MMPIQSHMPRAGHLAGLDRFAFELAAVWTRWLTGGANGVGKYAAITERVGWKGG